MRKYNLICNKHIPHDYKCNSKENRLKLLAGLIDNPYDVLTETNKNDIAQILESVRKGIESGSVSVKDVSKSISQIEEILECHHITGEGDFLLKIATRDIPHYDELILHGLSALANVQHLKTSVVLSTFKHKTQLPL